MNFKIFITFFKIIQNFYSMDKETLFDYSSSLFSFVAMIIAAVIPVFIYFSKSLIDVKLKKSEDLEVKDEISKYVEIIDKAETDVLKLMIKNVAEVREYYVINKQQARNSFSAALFISILGFLLFAGGVIVSFIYKIDSVIPYSTLGGVIVEIIAGLFFWLYSKAITQINIFHSSLLRTEKFLTAIQLVDKITYEQRDKTYSYIIQQIISQNSDDELKS